MKFRFLIFAIMLALIRPIGVLAAPKTAEDARQLIVSWLKRDPRPLGASLGQRVKEVQTFKDDKGDALYHVVYLNPSGFVIVPADDLVEPIIAFASQGRFDPSGNNPLGAWVSGDVPGRVAQARALRAAAPSGHFLRARNKWQTIQQDFNDDTNPATAYIINSIESDIRVAPFLQTDWNQGTTYYGMACFNYYTPPYAAGTASNYVCGCVATALAQLLDYFQYPTAGVGTNVMPISINGTNTTARLRGGDGAGGPYVWTNMPPNIGNPSVAQCQAIGALTYDSAVAVNMAFSEGGSGANVASPVGAFLQTFMYGNAIFGNVSNSSDFDPLLVTMVNANLDARLPVCVALNGHQVDCDGYGYSLSTLYNHLNMGWGGEGNAWYALPVVTTSLTNLWGFIYNIYTNGSGEIISGRVMAGNVPWRNAQVTALRTGGGTYTTTTDTNGIYALIKVPSASRYTLTVTAPSFTSASTNISTGTSGNFNTDSGNVWGVDFDLAFGIGPPLITAQPQNKLYADLGGSAMFNVSALGEVPVSYQWRLDGTNLLGANTASLAITNVQTTNTGNYCVVVSDASGSVTSIVATLSIPSYPTSGTNLTSQPGFLARCSQIDYPGADAASIMNSLTSMEIALLPAVTNNIDGGWLPSAGRSVDPTTGLFCANLANLSAADANGFFFVPGYINMDIGGPTNQSGYFNSSDGITGWPKNPFPGIPGNSQNNPTTSEFAVAFTAYVCLPAGVTEFGVAADDNGLLAISTGTNPNDVFSQIGTGGFGGQIVDVTVPTNGVYGLRLDYEQGGGGANCELFTVVNGVKILVNDTNTAGCLLAYPTPEVYAKPYAVLVSPSPGQTNVAFGSPVTVLLQDGVPTIVNTNSIVLKVNGMAVASTISQSPSSAPDGQPIGNLTMIAYDWTQSSPLSVGNTAELLFSDSQGNRHGHLWSFTNEPVLFAVVTNLADSASATNSGFMVYPWHTAGNEVNDVAVGTEEQILGWTGANYATLADWPNSQNDQTENAILGHQGWCFIYTNCINWDISGPTDGAGDFTSPDGVTGYPKQEFPGMIIGNYPDEGGFPTTDAYNFSMLVETWLNFPAAGTWQMGVNSDDGFTVKSGQAPGDVFGQLLGEFEGGRGTSDTLFSFYVPQPGLYPFRLLYEQGGGGANCEWFTVTPAGQRVLINDASQGTNAVYSYVGAANEPIYVSGVTPVNGATDVGANSDITAFLVDGNPVHVAGVQMWINGVPATVSTCRNNSVTTAMVVNSGSPSLLWPATTNTVTIVCRDDAAPPHSYTNSWQFTVAAASATSGYVTLNPAAVQPAVGATNSGFIVYPWHTTSVEPNDVEVWTEEQILGLLGPNYATMTKWPNSQNGQTENAILGCQGWCFVYTNYLNWDISGPTDGAGDFTSSNGKTGYPKQEFPGMIIGNYPDESGFPTTDVNNFSMLVETWLNFPAAGIWQMGVNSDDGFSVKSGQAPGDVFGQLLGECEGTRGASDTIFSFYVPQPGLYPFRLLYEQGWGGANCEWFTVTPAGQRVLINDASQGTNAVYGYATAASSPIYVSGVIPVNGASGIAPYSDITAFLVDGSSAKVTLVQMWVNGSSVALNTSRNDDVTTIVAANTGYPVLLLSGTSNTVTIAYGDNASPPHGYTNSWQFTTSTLDYPEWLGSTTSAGAGLWDINDAANTTWQDYFSHSPTHYMEGGLNDSVVFDDNATGTTVVTMTNTISPAAVTVSNTAKAYTFRGTGRIAGSSTTLTKEGPGTLALTESGGDSFGGGIMIAAGGGNVVLDNPNSAITGGATIGGGGTLQVGNNDASTGNLPGAVVDNGMLVLDRSDSGLTVASTISGTGGMAINGTGVVALTGTNTYAGGTTVCNGVLQITADSALGAVSSGLTLNGGCLKNNDSAPILNSSRIITLGTNGGFFDAGWNLPLTINSQITGSGQLMIDLDSDAPVVLGNTNNNYDGNTIIGTNGPGYYPGYGQAWLQLGASGVIPNGPGYGNLSINQSYFGLFLDGLFDLAGFSQTINGLSGNGSINNSTGNGSLTFGNNNQTSTFTGVIENTGGTLALTKIGSGVLTLSGANTYNGPTMVRSGTLALGATGSISNSASLSIAAGATFDVSAIASYALGVNTTLSASGTGAQSGSKAAIIKGLTTVNLGSQPLSLNFAPTAFLGDSNHPALYMAQGTLALNGNAFTVNNAAGTALGAGTYRLIQQANGSIISAGSNSVNVTGSGLPIGEKASIQVSGGNVNLVVSGIFIASQPSNQAIADGGTAIFSVTAGGNQPFFYQWQFNGGNLSGSTNSSLIITNVQLANAGNYSVIVTNGYGRTNSALVTLTVGLPPNIVSQPQSLTLQPGSNAFFQASVTGTEPITCHWQFDGTNLANSSQINGVQSNILSLSGVTLGNSGIYRIVVTNAFGSALSSNAILLVQAPPVFTFQPQSQSLPIGNTVRFQTVVQGSLPLSYHWYFKNNLLPGATNSTLLFGPILTNQSGNYQVLVSNLYGSATSAVAVLTVLLQPNAYGISNGVAGSRVLLLASLPGSTNLVWATTNLNQPLSQWQLLGTVIAGTNGLFEFVDTNAVGKKQEFYSLSLLVITPPSITSQPHNMTVIIGNPASISASASGTPPLIYQWYFNNSIDSGATNTLLRLAPALTNEAGNYQLVVTNLYGTATSTPANLTVLLQPNIYGLVPGTNGSFTLDLASTPGSTNRVWTSTNLLNWQVLMTNNAGANGLFQFLDTNAHGLKAKFYRLSTP